MTNWGSIRKVRLVVIELKDASKRSTEVYYSPFQLLQYIWEWGSELEDVLGSSTEDG